MDIKAFSSSCNYSRRCSYNVGNLDIRHPGSLNCGYRSNNRCNHNQPPAGSSRYRNRTSGFVDSSFDHHNPAANGWVVGEVDYTDTEGNNRR